MQRRVFFSFHYSQDAWRASQIRNIGTVDGNRPCSDNDWEEVKKGGDIAIERWIADQMEGRSCVVVLIGSKTADRKWINYEIKNAWAAGKGLVGIHIHNLANSDNTQSVKGNNPFDYVFTKQGRRLSSIVETYDPPFHTSKNVYDYIKTNLAAWIEEAIAIRDSQRIL